MTPQTEFRALPPEQQEELRQQATQWAKEARAQTLREFLGWFLAKTATLARRSFEAYRTWRTRREAIRELHGLDNRMLRDMGIGRSEIEWLVTSGGAAPAGNKNTAGARTQPPAPLRAAKKPAQVFEKRAA